MIDILDHAVGVACAGEAEAAELHVIQLRYGIENQRIGVDVEYSVKLCGQKFMRGEPIICLFGYPVLGRSVGIELMGETYGMHVEAAAVDAAEYAVDIFVGQRRMSYV